MLHAAVRHLPLPFHLLVPELRVLDFPEEAGSSCSACPMARPANVPVDAPGRVWFDPEMRCCSFHPFVPSFLAGRALRRGGAGAERILARLDDRAGVSALGIEPPPAYSARYDAQRGEGFGRDLSLKCPFWVTGPYSCSIWQDRTATCRTWHCKHDHGLAGHAMWGRAREVLRVLEIGTARWCATQVQAPDAETASVASWVDYFLRCATEVEQVDVDDVLALVDDELLEARRKLRLLYDGLQLPVPDVLAPRVRQVERLGDGRVRLTGYSPYDLLEAPDTVFALLARCDGVRPWRDALADVAEAHPELDEALVAELARYHLLAPPLDGHDPFATAPDAGR